MTVYVYVLETMADWEIAYAMAELNSKRFFKKGAPEITVKTVGAAKTPVRTMGGLTVLPDCTIEDIRRDDTAMLILPGGDTWAEPVNASIIEKASQLLDAGIPVCAICGATVALASAGLLDERKHTSNGAGFLDMFCPSYKGAPNYVDEPAIQDNGLITAAGTAPLPFARLILQKLGVFSEAALEAWYGYFSTGSPDMFYALMGAVQSGT